MLIRSELYTRQVSPTFFWLFLVASVGCFWVWDRNLSYISYHYCENLKINYHRNARILFEYHDRSIWIRSIWISPIFYSLRFQIKNLLRMQTWFSGVTENDNMYQGVTPLASVLQKCSYNDLENARFFWETIHRGGFPLQIFNV